MAQGSVVVGHSVNTIIFVFLLMPSSLSHSDSDSDSNFNFNFNLALALENSLFIPLHYHQYLPDSALVWRALLLEFWVPILDDSTSFAIISFVSFWLDCNCATASRTRSKKFTLPCIYPLVATVALQASSSFLWYNNN